MRPPTLPPRRAPDRGPFVLPASLDRLSETWWSLHPRLRVALTTVAAIAIVVAAGARGLAAPHGPERDVWVARSTLPAGTTLDDHPELTRATRPDGLLPDDPAAAPTGRLTGPLPAGAVLTEQHLAVGGIGDLAGPDRVAVPVPPDALPPVALHDRLQLIVADSDGTGRVVADAVEVLALDDDATWLATDPAASVDVAAGGARGTLTATVLPP